ASAGGGGFGHAGLSNAGGERETTVLLPPRHFEQQFEDCDVIAANLIAQMRLSTFPSAEEFKARLSTVEAHDMLHAKASVSSYIGSISIFDADGQLINSADTNSAETSSTDTWPLPSASP